MPITSRKHLSQGGFFLAAGEQMQFIAIKAPPGPIAFACIRIYGIDQKRVNSLLNGLLNHKTPQIKRKVSGKHI
ncbi:MAG: hypothetical protein ACE5R6_12440 [Candidatus Heimdallarchaeota archaeon]